MNASKKTPKEIIPKERKIFLNNMNSWFSNFVIESLRTETVTDPKVTRNEFMGTRNMSKMKLPHLFKPTEVKVDYNHHYEHELFTNDVYIYNMEDSDYKEIEYIIKGLKTLKHQTEKTLIIISSIMTWARTPPKVKKEKTEEEENLEGESEEEEAVEDEPQVDEQEQKENPQKVLSFKDRDYISRIPSKKYYNYKMIETLALSASATNPMLKTYIICPGFIYGFGEDLFYNYFKMAWLTEPHKLPLIGDGKNCIPTIHIVDLVSLIKRIIDKKPSCRYILAVDRTKNRSLKNIITSISKSTGSGLVEQINDFTNNTLLHSLPALNELSINVKAKTSKVFDDQREEGEDDEDFLKRRFPWHCEFGIPENLEKIRNEFTTYRNLKSLKILVTGPPASGKSTLADKLSKYLNLPILKISEIIEFGLNLQDKLGEDIQAKIEEEREKMLLAIEEAQKKNKNKKKEPLPEKSSLHPRLPDDLVSQILKRKLSDNLYRNRGYILDGYPRGHGDAQMLFYEVDPEKAEDDPTRNVLQKEMLPNNVIRFEGASDEQLKNRIKSLTGISLGDPHYSEEAMNRRLSNYRLINESPKGEPSLSDFFLKLKVEVFPIDCRLNESEVVGKAKVFFERNGVIFNYQNFDQDEEKEHKNKFENKNEIESKKHASEAKENEFFENQKQEEKKDLNEDKLKQLKERERQLLEKKSEVLRRYLLENVIPILSKGIMEVCKELPNDPVDFLADFLFENSMKVKFPPTQYKEN